MSTFRIGNVTIGGRVLTAPMTGVSDLPFRRAASRLGAAYVATEMVACDSFARGRPDVVRRAAIGDGLPLMVIQLVGREEQWLAKGAAMAEAAGADIIDINMGCPAKEVTGALSGSALMRDLEPRRLALARGVKRHRGAERAHALGASAPIRVRPCAHQRGAVGLRAAGGEVSARGHGKTGPLCDGADHVRLDRHRSRAHAENEALRDVGGKAGRRPCGPASLCSAGSSQLDVEDRHREIVVAVVLVLEDDAEELVTDIDLG